MFQMVFFRQICQNFISLPCSVSLLLHYQIPIYFVIIISLFAFQICVTQEYINGAEPICVNGQVRHHDDVIIGAMASQTTSFTTVYPTAYSNSDQRKHQKFRVTGLCAGNLPGTGEFPAQMASNAGNVSIWWRHRGLQPIGPISPSLLSLSETRVMWIWPKPMRDCDLTWWF